jgi:poly(hydroxyalkanoate) depolymerase family esterase
MAGSAATVGQRLGAAALSGAKPKRKAATQKKAHARKPASSATPATRSAPRLPEGAEVGQFRNLFGTRSYRLYRPEISSESGTRPPLIVMLHGCTQNASGFSRITRMPALAGAQGCWVLFPEQSAEANRGRCWQWFEPGHQQRGAGEPAILAGMVRKLVRQHRLDGRRVFVAGLSAGGAMAVILGRTYPELFRAVGVCAGMPYGSARSAATAMLAMRGRQWMPIGRGALAEPPGKPVRTIVVQGDRDRTVAPRNAETILRSALDAFGPNTDEQEAGAAGGRNVTRACYRTKTGLVAAEAWTIHGAGHVWNGGAPGAFSDPRGPDVSAVMLRFFLSPQD